jgi:hypothetical protein
MAAVAAKTLTPTVVELQDGRWSPIAARRRERLSSSPEEK